MIWVDPNLPDDVRRNIINNHVINMQELLKSKGWIELEAYLKAEEAQAYETLSHASTGDMAMKASGAYVAICNLRKLPESSLNQCLEALKQMSEKPLPK